MKKEKILILGATGMAGHVIYYYLKSLDRYEIINVAFRNKLTDDSILLDINDIGSVALLLAERKPDVVINCIGVLIKGAQSRPDNAVFVNAYFPRFLDAVSGELNFWLIHISTDCVFSGRKGNYAETDFCDADDVYGRSKALGEITQSKNLTIRTSIIGPELKEAGEGLFHWFMNQKGKIKGYTKAVWGGVTTMELAKSIDYVLQNPIAGLVHLTNGIGISKYDLLSVCKDVYGRTDIDIVPEDGKKVNKSLQKSEEMKYVVPDYVQMIKDMRNWMIEHDNLYSNIY